MKDSQNKVMQLRDSVLAGNEKKIAAQHEAKKLTAKERIAKLADEGSFTELFTLLGGVENTSGVVTGFMTVDARPVYVFAQDFTCHGGAMGKLQAEKIVKLLDLAVKTGAPVVALMDSAGVCIDEGALAMNAFGDVYQKLARMSGVCPILSVVAGPCIGGAALISELADVNIMVEGISSLMVFGPQVMAAMNGAAVDAQAFGGAAVSCEKGTAALSAKNEDEASELVKKLLGLLPSSNLEDGEIVDSDDMGRLIPEIDAGDMDAVIAAIADQGSAIELFKAFAPAVKTVLCRMGGRPVMVVGACGKLDAAALRKAARMVRFADSFNLPIVSLLNTDGVLVENTCQQAALIKAQSQLLYSYAEATAPKASVVLGKAIGQAYIAMGAKANADVAYAWPDAVISALTPEAAVTVLYADQVKADKKLTPAEARAKYAAEYVEKNASALNAAAAGLIDDVIEPEKTRAMLISALEMLASKRDSNPPKKHGNLPL